MPRRLSEDTKSIYRCLWRLPWASAADIARVTDLKQSAVSNALKRGERRGWLRSARLGRAVKVADRFVFSNVGIAEMRRQFGWEAFWWHTANGVRALARRLEIVELAYRYLPRFWQSNAVSKPSVWVYANRIADTGPGEPDRMRIQLAEENWYNASLMDFHWLERGPIEAIASYTNGYHSSGYLRLPVLWRGNFQKPSHVGAASAVPALSSITGSQTVCPGLANRSTSRAMAISRSLSPSGSSPWGGTSNRSSIPFIWNVPLL